MEYTKGEGEWRAISVPFENGQQYIVLDGKVLASVKTKVDDHKLMASAPDLYEALKLTRDNLQTLSNAAIHYEKTFKANLIVLNQALAKVEGR